MSDPAFGSHVRPSKAQDILAQFAELALRSENLDEILTEACRLVGEALGTDLAKVVELQADGHTLLVRAGVGWRPGIVGEVTIEADEDTSEGHALKTRRPMISPDIGEERRFSYPSFLTDHGVKAVANVVIIGGRDRGPYGILQIDSRTPRQFTEADTAFLQGYANLLAAAVDRLRALDEVRQTAERTRLVLEARVAERTSELTRANELLEEFASSISHDLRAPLRGMEGFARILLDDFAPALGTTGLHYAQRIVAAAKRMENLITDLLSYSRVQRTAVRLRMLDPTPLAHEAAEEALAAAVDPEGVDIIVKPMPPVYAHPVVLGQALNNLLSNAVKFRNPERPSHVVVRGQRHGDRMRIWVEDDGIGIASDDFERIFVAFERLHGEEAYPGTGIGLAIVQAAALRMGGTCGVDSSVGHGARFYLELGAQPPEAAVSGANPNDEQDGDDSAH
ncbi:MAG: hypothetical protein JWO26_3276 [Rhodospirillales bacterium]|nr:hypothetical protein [Rhodospirillales bacterium]MDB5383644.1 hypothetical protein [Rhodospirillales bacterium]